MGGTKSNHFQKEPYRKPTCESKSVIEVAALIRENLLEQHEADRVPLSMEELARPILVVEDYAGHVRSLKEAIQNSRMECHVVTVADSSELPLIRRASGAVRADILLLDLRLFEHLGRGVLMKIGKEPRLKSIPFVILANSAAVSQILKDYDLHNLWRLSKPADSEPCVTALRRLLDLQRAILKLPPKGEQEDSPYCGDRRADPAGKAR